MKIRKGKGKPIETKQAYLMDEHGRSIVEFWTPSFLDITKSITKKKYPDTFRKIFSRKGISIQFNKSKGSYMITTFHGKHPQTISMQAEDLINMFWNTLGHFARTKGFEELLRASIIRNNGNINTTIIKNYNYLKKIGEYWAHNGRW